MLLELRDKYDSEPDAIRAISSKIGCHYDTLRAWLRQHKNDVRGGASLVSQDVGELSTNERQRLQELERENRSYAAAMTYCARPLLILRRRSSIATGKNNATYATSEWYTWGRAGMSRAGYCPVDILLASTTPATS
ncbi:is629 transposase [Lasius niger]|uniref:Is629 transposase n=1 Tax=Lasius niger TaxID=67767 RepID=A0A0J7K0B9_LASNI|nr:is629 transposase [Lasius niger]